MRAAWAGLEFRVLDFKDTGTYILGGIDEVQACLASAINRLSDAAHIALLSAM